MEEVTRKEVEHKYDEINVKFLKIQRDFSELQIEINKFWGILRG